MAFTKFKTWPLVLAGLYLLSLVSGHFDFFVSQLGRTVIFAWLAWQLTAFIVLHIILPRRPPIDVRGKSVLVTGCDSGFGYRTALKLNERGFRVFAGCLLPESSGAQSLVRAARYPKLLHVVQLDVTKDESVNNAHAEVKRLLAGDGARESELYALVNNAGVLRVGECEFSSFEHNFETIFQVNTLGLVKVTRRFLPLIRSCRGRVVNVNSTAARYTVSYCMSKHASLAFTEGLRYEMMKFGVKVVSVEPYIYKTPMANQEGLVGLSDQALESTSDDVIRDYGLHYIKRLNKTNVTAGKLASENIDDVPSAILDALVSHEPEPRYNCCALWMKPVIWLGLVIPIEMQDYVWRLFLLLCKRNRPLPDASASAKNK